MSGVKTCPLCGVQRWADGKAVIEQHDLQEFRLFGYTAMQLSQALQFAIERGWKE